MSEQLTPNFSLAELTVTNRKLPNVPNASERAALKALAVNILQPLRALLGRPVRVNSAFRSEAVNRAVGGVSNSQHRLGQAADIVVPAWNGLPAMSSQALAQFIINHKLPFDQLIEEEKVWVHVSYGPRNRREVKHMRRNSAGKAVYKPGLE